MTGNAFTSADLTYGSRGYDVDELQNRLKLLGYYYYGKVDGIFGWDTYWAVRDFQYKFGMKVTGVVDMATKIKLVAATPNWRYAGSKNGGPAAAQQISATNGYSTSDINLMAHVVYAEERNQPFEGQVAVAAVILNRLRSPKFPTSIPGVVYQPGAFTSVQNGQINLQPNTTAYTAVLDAIHGWDPSYGALYYFNPATSTSSWIWSQPEIVKIGNTIFSK